MINYGLLQMLLSIVLHVYGQWTFILDDYNNYEIYVGFELSFYLFLLIPNSKHANDLSYRDFNATVISFTLTFYQFFKFLQKVMLVLSINVNLYFMPGCISIIIKVLVQLKIAIQFGACDQI